MFTFVSYFGAGDTDMGSQSPMFFQFLVILFPYYFHSFIHPWSGGPVHIVIFDILDPAPRILGSYRHGPRPSPSRIWGCALHGYIWYRLVLEYCTFQRPWQPKNGMGTIHTNIFDVDGAHGMFLLPRTTKSVLNRISSEPGLLTIM
jgi:hypothetical protein